MAKFSFFSFEWLSSKEREQRKEEIALRKAEIVRQEQPKANFGDTVQPTLQQEFKAQGLKFDIPKPFKSCRLLGTTVLVVLNDGTTLTKDDPSILGAVRACQNEEEVLQLFIHRQYEREEDRREAELVWKNSEILRGREDFIVEGENVFLKGVGLAMPPIVVASFIEILEKLEGIWDSLDEGCMSCDAEELEESFEALKVFWLKLCLNGREQSREDLLLFCRKNDVRITRNGNLILYRNIVALGNLQKPLTEFISQQYFRIKSFKKSPKNYWVWAEDGGTFRLITEDWTDSGVEKNLGSLYDLYVDLPNQEENKFTSWNNRGKHEINIGSIYRIEEGEINLDNGICAAGGLHAANVNYDYSGFGDTKIVVLVSPSKAITVPTGDFGKLRTTEMFVCCINDRPYGEHFSEGDLSAFDEEYNHLSVYELEESIDNKSFEAISVKEEVSPLTAMDMQSIRNMLCERIVKV